MLFTWPSFSQMASDDLVFKFFRCSVDEKIWCHFGARPPFLKFLSGLCFVHVKVLTLTDADISEPPCNFLMFQYQAFSDDLNSPVCVPDVMLCETLVVKRKMTDHHLILFTVFSYILLFYLGEFGTIFILLSLLQTKKHVACYYQVVYDMKNYFRS